MNLIKVSEHWKANIMYFAYTSFISKLFIIEIYEQIFAIYCTHPVLIHYVILYSVPRILFTFWNMTLIYETKILFIEHFQHGPHERE